jgi:hypothetical protein
MDITKISNLLNKLVQADETLKFYHFGELSELNISPQNNFNKDGENGRLYPCLDWLVPENISFVFDDYETETIKIELIFTDLYGYDNKTEINTRTKNEVWRDLIALVKRFLVWFDAALQENGAGCIVSNETVNLELNSMFKDRTLEIKANFNIQVNTDCIDIENLVIPNINKDFDLENYCNLEYCYTFLNGVNQFSQLGANSYFDNLERNTPLSISFWINATPGVLSARCVFTKSLASSDKNIFLNILSDIPPISAFFQRTISFQLRSGVSAPFYLYVYSNNKVPFGEWVNVILTHDGSGLKDGVTFYINNVASPKPNFTPINSDECTAGSIKNNELPLFGAFPEIGWYAEGCYNNLAFFDKELSPEEVESIFNKGRSNPSYIDIDGIRLHYKLAALNETDEIENNTLTSINQTENNIICEEL